MAEHHDEREDKFDVDTGWNLPDLADVIPAGAAVEQATVSMTSRYFDTVDHALLGRGVTLRLRTGDADTGWHLKLPHGAARTEMRLPINGTSRSVPSEFRDLLLGLRGGDVLKPVAVLDTVRSASRVVDESGTLLAEIADDQVTANAGDGTHEWREVEVELGTGDEALLAAIGDRLVATGAKPARTSSKLARVLPGTAPGHRGSKRPRTLAELVTGYLADQYEALLTGDLALRQNQDAAHPTRVATRRYRSVLRIFADLFDPDRAAALDAELAWYASLLGEVRDREVLRRHLDKTVASLPSHLVLGPVRANIDQQLHGEQLKAHQALLRQMRTKRYLALLAELKTWHQEPAFTDSAAAPAADVDAYVHSAGRKLAKRLKQAARTGADDRLHRARKAGKRTRYTAEVAKPVLGKPARRIVKRATALQDILGEQHDSIVAGEVLLRLGATAGTRPGENGFTYGLLYAREQDRSQTTRDHARRLTWPT